MSQIKITPALLSDLRQKIEACASKEWVVNNPKKHDPDFSGISGVRTSDGYPVIHWSDHPHEGIYSESYAEFIAAANPAVMLALVAEVEWQKAQHIEEIKNCIDLQKIIDDLKKEIEDLKDRCDC